MPPGNDNVAITDITGRDVYQAALPGANQQSGTMQVDIAAIHPGVYFVKIGGSGVRKFVKE